MAIDIAAYRERNNPKKDTVAQETPQFLSREERGCVRSREGTKEQILSALL